MSQNNIYYTLLDARELLYIIYTKKSTFFNDLIMLIISNYI